MATVNPQLHESTLAALRQVHSQLYAIPEAEVQAMSAADQTDYANSLHQYSLAILKLETAQLKGVNEQFKALEAELENAAMRLKNDAKNLNDSIMLVHMVSKSVTAVTKVVELLA